MSPARVLKNGKFWEFCVFLLLTGFILSTILLPLRINIKATPPGTTYAYGSGYLTDYYQYLSYIKQGMQGKIPLETRYTWEAHPSVIIHPFFPVLGYLSRPFHTDPFVTLMIARVIAAFLFCLTFFLLIRKVLPTTVTRLLALLLLFSITDLWSIRMENGIQTLIEPISGQTNFSVLGKFALSPHHLLAIACTLLSLSMMQTSLITTRKLFAVFLLGMCAAFLNPSFTSIILISFAVSIPCLILQSWKTSLRPLSMLIAFSIPAAAVIGYHQIIFKNISPYSLWYTLAQLYNPAVTLSQYLMALGPVLLLPFFLFLKKEYRTSRLMPILFSWAYVPIVLFQLRNGLVPMNAQRIFQSYQYIPLAILGVMGIDGLGERVKGKESSIIRNVLPLHAFPFTLIFFFLLYAIPPAKLLYTQSLTPLPTNFYNIYIPDSAMKAFHYLDSMTPDESVVVTGEFVSNMLPGFTHNRVILGRDDAIPEYHAHKEKVFEFLDGRMATETEWRYFAINHKIKYILTGIDTFKFEGSNIAKYPYVKEVFKDGNVSVVEVTP